EIDSMPAELDHVTRRVMQLEIEEAALGKEKDDASKRRLVELRKELSDLRREGDSLRAQWQTEKAGIKKLQALREQIETARADIEKAKRAYDLNTAAELEYGTLPALQKQLEAEEKNLATK